ncbi:AmmeMemoRadiSam system protein B [Natranaerofaba carboxydovora]|uniref:AmmeMemoRadiSam system protein B n=1 Tax=Natranaerofaba carboxydovora TaxID=2742683 RepID=UPI001F12AC09|nr:AmmeMemoRadiSam system protein B [Natranaerofaba carboxydovora]UMZ75431.1 Catalytic LigB subunit of aromatic ring-opening dioxygenase [Natranaerofaba carboxydovora]
MALKWAVLTPHPPLLVPEIGKDALNQVIDTKKSMEKTFEELKNDNVDTLLIITPHGPYLSDEISIWDKDILEGSLARFGGREKLKFDCDRDLVKEIADEWEKHRMPYSSLGEDESARLGEELDHGAFVPLYYLNQSFDNKVNLVSITPGGADYDLLWKSGELLGQVINDEDKNIGVIVSGDLSHRLTRNAPAGYHPEAHKFDQKLKEILNQGNFSLLKEIPEKLLIQTGECGYRPMLIAGGLLENLHPNSEVFSYEGPFGVGYMVALLYRALNESDKEGEKA